MTDCSLAILILTDCDIHLTSIQKMHRLLVSLLREVHQTNQGTAEGRVSQLVMHVVAYIRDGLLPRASHTLWFHPLRFPGNAGVCPSKLLHVGKLKAPAGEEESDPPLTVLAGVSSSGTCDRSLVESCRLPRSWQRGVKAALLLHKLTSNAELVMASACPAHEDKHQLQVNPDADVMYKKVGSQSWTT